MPNAWIEHVRKYAKDNNVSYACAVSQAKASYKSAKAPKAAAKTPKVLNAPVRTKYTVRFGIKGGKKKPTVVNKPIMFTE